MLKSLACLSALAVASAASASHCESGSAALFCDDFASGDLSHWIDVTSIASGVPPVPSPVSGGPTARLDYLTGTNAGWMWKKHLRPDSAAQDRQYIRWWQYWPQGFEWFQGTSGDQKQFLLFGLSPQDAWAQTADWQIYLHLNGNIQASWNIAPNVLAVTLYRKSNGVDKWRDIGQNVAVIPYQTGKWHCTEAEVLHNAPGQSNGELRVWIDDTLVMEYSNVVFRDSAVSWNAIMLSGWYAGGSPKNQSSFVDDVEVSGQRIGCTNQPAAPLPPTNLTAN